MIESPFLCFSLQVSSSDMVCLRDLTCFFALFYEGFFLLTLTTADRWYPCLLFTACLPPTALLLNSSSSLSKRGNRRQENIAKTKQKERKKEMTSPRQSRGRSFSSSPQEKNRELTRNDYICTFLFSFPPSPLNRRKTEKGRGGQELLSLPDSSTKP